MSWARFEEESPALAAEGRRLIFRGETGKGLLATVRGAGLPRVHPVWVAIHEGRLVTFTTPSAKLADLERDGRFAFHAHVDPVEPSEFLIRGRATPIAGAARRSIEEVWPFTPGPDYGLFELGVEAVVAGHRADEDDYPPRYTSWRAASDR
jgi:hypothetical protein